MAVAVLAPMGLAQGSWAPAAPTPPYTFLDPTQYLGGYPEIAHAALIGRPGPHRGKVVFWRRGYPRTAWLWDPAAPDAAELAITGLTPGVEEDLFCSGHSFDQNGDLIVAGGEMWYDIVPPLFTCKPEPNWTYELRTAGDDPTWYKTDDMLLDPLPVPIPALPEPQTSGHYYSGVIALPLGGVLSAAGTTNPAFPGRCERLTTVRSNEFQVYDTNSPPVYGGQTDAWRGMSATEPFPGLTEGLIGTTGFGINGFFYYPLMQVLHSGHVFAATCMDAGYDTNPNGFDKDWSPSALLNGMTSFPTNPASWSWTTQAPSKRLRNFTVTSGNDTVNLRWANAILRPYEIDTDGQVSKDNSIVIGGHDRHYNYQQPFNYNALNLVWEIEEPHLSTSSWGPLGGNPVPGPGNPAFMNKARVYGNTVLLPDLSAVTLGGSENDFLPFNTPTGTPAEEEPTPVYTPERLDFLSTTPSWQQPAPQRSPRLYHAVNLLLKDGRIASFGGYWSPFSQQLGFLNSDCEIFSPPYLGTDVLRPVIMSAPTNIPYGGSPISVQVAVPNSSDPANEIAFATLIRCGSVTHHFDWDQRAIKLSVLSAGLGTITLTALPDVTNRGHFLAPPGWYMLFVVRKLQPPPLAQVRVPSVAKFVHIP